MNIVKNLLRENLHIESSLLEIKDELDFSAFKMNNTLNGDIWKSEDKIKGPIKNNLIKIANDYWDSLELDFEYKDITMTGSLANFNWSRYSDVDLHIIFDINELGENDEMIKALLDTKTRAWNTEHDITIKTYDVEIYLQPEDQEHHSTGVYSLLNDEWVTKPEKQVVKLDKENIRKKYKQLVKSVGDIEEKAKASEYEQVIKYVETIKDKIKKMRQSGLEENGEFSVENVVFKLLRRNDIIERLGRLQTKAYDDLVSIDEKIS
jgi:hypothetical protein